MATSDRIPLSSLLVSLGSGISPNEWGQQLAEALRLGDIDADTATALRQLHARLEEAARREALLRVLYDTSTDLIGIRDVDAILKAIVRRTRSLIGSDLAYLSLNDYIRNESYIRVTDGATTAQFRNIRIPLGGGVLGAVATGSAPAQSADYPNDTTKTHFPDSDAAVIAEGVKAIMGIPLWAGGKVIGALMVADRRSHKFSRDDINLLESIGAHAAVALENARLFTEITETVQQLSAAQDDNIRHTQALETLASLDRQLMETLTAADILPRLQQLVATSLNANTWILDPAGKSIGTGSSPEYLHSPELTTAVERSRELNAPIRFEVAGTEHTLTAAVAGDQHLATVVVAIPGKDTHLVILERAGLVLTAALLFARSLRDAQYRLQRELIDEILAPRTEITDALRERARRFGVVGDHPLTVRVIGVDGDQRRRALAILRSNAGQRPGVIAIHGGSVCIVEPVDLCEPSPGAKIVAALAREGITSNVGSSMPVASLGELPAAFAEAQSVHSALVALDRSGEAADRATLGTAGMLLAAMDSPFTLRLLKSQLGALMDYDQRRDTQLTETAWVYLDSDASNAVAASRLHIHPNTLRQRLSRIDSILDAEWRRGPRALNTHVALQVWRMRSRGVGRYTQD